METQGVKLVVGLLWVRWKEVCEGVMVFRWRLLKGEKGDRYELLHQQWFMVDAFFVEIKMSVDM